MSMNHIHAHLRWFLTMGALAAAPVAHAGLVVNENSTWPTSPALETAPRTAAGITSERDVRFDRNVLQTFQVPSSFELDRIFIDYEEGLAGKEFTIRLFTVPDVNGTTILDPGNGSYVGTVLIAGLTHTTTAGITTADGGNDPLAVMEFDLTGADQVTLNPSTGTAGYALQILRTGTGSTTDNTAERVFKWHFGGGISTGRAYQVNGSGGPGTTSDFTMALVAVPEPSTATVFAVGAAGLLLRRRRMV
jgi:hypothetical protein